MSVTHDDARRPRWYREMRVVGALTPAELAHHCGVAEATIVRMLERGELDSFGDGSEAHPWLVEPGTVTLEDIWAARGHESERGPS